MLSNDPPPTSPPNSSRQILQLYCLDLRAAGAQATKGKTGWRGGGGDGMGKRMVSRKIRGEGTETPLPWFNLYTRTSFPWPPASTPAPSLPCNTALFRSAALPHVRRVQLRVVPPGAARPCLVCGWRRGGQAWQGGHVAASALFFWISRGAVMTLRYSCAYRCLSYLNLQWPLTHIWTYCFMLEDEQLWSGEDEKVIRYQCYKPELWIKRVTSE